MAATCKPATPSSVKTLAHVAPDHRWPWFTGFFEGGVHNRRTGGGYVRDSQRRSSDDDFTEFVIAGRPPSRSGNGAVIVDGLGSSLQIGESYTSAIVGHGTLEIRNGGQVSSQGWADRQLPFQQTIGIVTVDGLGSSWANTSSLTIQGNAGAATLQVTGGGSVSNTQGFIGNSGGTNGEATVDGTGSQWINSGNLSVGSSGNGLLSVTNGGLVQTPNLIIGVNGQLQGDGNIVGNVQNAGVVSPGSSPGALHVAGNYTQTATGELVIGLASTSSYDQLLVTGNISLAGTLRVPIEGFFRHRPLTMNLTFSISPI